MPEAPVTLEATTIGTNLIIVLSAFGSGAALVRAAPASPVRRVWVLAFSLMGAIGITGSAAHAAVGAGLQVGPYWRLSYIVLACASSLILVGAVATWRGYAVARRLFAPALAAVVAYFGATWRASNDELVLATFASATIGIALAIFARLGTSRAHRTPGAALAAWGLALLFVAAAIQLDMSEPVRFVWTFDHNGVAHLVAAVAIVLLAAGVRAILPALRHAAD